MLSGRMSAVTDVIATVLPYAFVIASAIFVGRFLPRSMLRSRSTIAVVVPSILIGAFWGFGLVAIAALGDGMSQPEALMALAGGILVTVAGSLDVWTLVTRNGRRGALSVLLAIVLGALVAPGMAWLTMALETPRGEPLAAVLTLVPSDPRQTSRDLVGTVHSTP
jgi:hypothetical protein